MNLTLLGYRSLEFICKRTPLFIADFIIKILSWVYYKCDRKNRKNVEKNMRLIGEHLGIDISSKVPEVYYQFACFIFEFFSKMKCEVKNEVSFDSKVHELLGPKGNKPYLIIVSHQGNWEFSCRKIMDLGYPVTSIALESSNKEVTNFFYHLRQHPMLELFYLKDGIQPCLDAIARNRIIALACDRDYTNRGVEVIVASQKVSFPVGPAYIARKTRIPIFLSTSKRISLGCFEMNLKPVCIEVGMLDKDKAIENISQAIATILFEQVLKCPEQWVTFDDYFSKKDYAHLNIQ